MRCRDCTYTNVFLLPLWCLSVGQKVDGAGRSSAQSSRHAAPGQSGSHCSREEAEGCQSHPLHDSGSVLLTFRALLGDWSYHDKCVFLCFSSGTFAECSSEAEVQYWTRYNIFLLLDVGTFSALVELLNMEMEYVLQQQTVALSHLMRCSNPLFSLSLSPPTHTQ